MGITKREFSFPAANGWYDIYACCWRDEDLDEYKGVIQIAHGMCEYILRYEDFAKYLARHGYVVYGADTAGHGKSIRSIDDLGHFGDGEDNWVFLIEDMRRLMQHAKEEYPGHKHFLIGFSFGSFIAKAFMSLYGSELAGAVLIGTARKVPMVDVFLALCDGEIEVHGIRSKGVIMYRIGVDRLNLGLSPRRSAFDWICSVNEVSDEFLFDPLCGYPFTYAGYRDMLRLTKEVTGLEWAEKLPKELPVLLASGAEDPVGEYGKGILEIYDTLKEAGLKKVTVKLFSGCRHEIINEKRKDEVYHYLLSWIDKKQAE